MSGAAAVRTAYRLNVNKTKLYRLAKQYYAEAKKYEVTPTAAVSLEAEPREAPAQTPEATPEREEPVSRYAAVELTEEDAYILACLVYHEARGEPFEGQAAVQYPDVDEMGPLALYRLYRRGGARKARRAHGSRRNGRQSLRMGKDRNGVLQAQGNFCRGRRG